MNLENMVHEFRVTDRALELWVEGRHVAWLEKGMVSEDYRFGYLVTPLRADGKPHYHWTNEVDEGEVTQRVLYNGIKKEGKSWEDFLREWYELSDFPAPKIRELLIREAELPEVGWPGGYPIVYITNDGKQFCGRCAYDACLAEARDPLYVYPEIRDYDVYYEGPAVECDGGCGRVIESAYGEVESEQ